MSDDPVRTMIATDAGDQSFQEYFVRDQCRPIVHAIRFEGAGAARPTPQVLAALAAPTLAGIIIGPSNPWLSIDPILAVPGLPAALQASGAPIVAVSPIIAGSAVKGPAAKIMAELGLAPDSCTIAQHYAGLIDGFIVDNADAKLAHDPRLQTRSGRQLPTLVTNTMMRTLDDKVALARQCLEFCGKLAGERAVHAKVEQ
jgi:LPPG:FO 2-phospho-L-lactate transferase